MKSVGFALILAGTMAAGCVATTTRGRLYVRVGPPPLVVESRMVAPGPAYIWVPGYYRWDGRGYIWTAGRYELPPRPRAVWVAGHWQRDRHGWYFIDGHWRY